MGGSESGCRWVWAVGWFGGFVGGVVSLALFSGGRFLAVRRLELLRGMVEDGDQISLSQYQGHNPPGALRLVRPQL